MNMRFFAIICLSFFIQASMAEIVSDNATYHLDYASNCSDAKDAQLILSWTQINCLDPQGNSKSTSYFANTKVKFNSYDGAPMGPFSATCENGRKITQFDVLHILKGKKDNQTHYYIIDCPRMHEGKIDYAEYYAPQSNNNKTTCVCNQDIGGKYTSTFGGNLQPFLYTDWKRSDFNIKKISQHFWLAVKYALF